MSSRPASEVKSVIGIACQASAPDRTPASATGSSTLRKRSHAGTVHRYGGTSGSSAVAFATAIAFG